MLRQLLLLTDRIKRKTTTNKCNSPISLFSSRRANMAELFRLQIMYTLV